MQSSGENEVMRDVMPSALTMGSRRERHDSACRGAPSPKPTGLRGSDSIVR